MDALLDPERRLMTQSLHNLSILHAMDKHTVPARDRGDRARTAALETFVSKIARAPVDDCSERDLAFYAVQWYGEARRLMERCDDDRA
jgi:hypothetical protein